MSLSIFRRLALLVPLAIVMLGTRPVLAEGNPQKAKHIIIVMQENHSFDNYFGALAYAPGSPYHSPEGDPDRDRDLEDMFDFDGSPSLNTKVGTAAPPVQDCTPH